MRSEVSDDRRVDRMERNDVCVGNEFIRSAAPETRRVFWMVFVPNLRAFPIQPAGLKCERFLNS